MIEVSLSLAKELRDLTGWEEPYTLGFLVGKILTVHQIKFKTDKDKVIATAPQMYRFEARSAEDAACMMTIALVKGELLK